MAAVANALPATTISGSVLTTAETTPALQNVIASNKPTWGTLTAGGQQNTGGGPLYTQGGWINTGGAPLYSGSLNTGSISSGSINTNGQPINQGFEYHGPQTICGNYSCVTSSDQIWAQPCSNAYGCLSWGWYPRGSGVSYFAGSGGRTCGNVPGISVVTYSVTIYEIKIGGCGFNNGQAWWNTNYGSTLFYLN